MRLTNKQIKDIEKLTGLKFDRARMDDYKFSGEMINYSDKGRCLRDNKELTMEYVSLFIGIQDDIGKPKHTISLSNRSEIPIKWLIPLGKILGGKDE